LNGMVADKGREVGVPTPACDAVVRLVQEAGVGKLVP
jgi:ketopantoate reductase